MTKCIICNKEFEAKRKTAKFCSSKCRKLAFQNKENSVPQNAKISVPEVSVPENKIIIPKYIEGQKIIAIVCFFLS